MKINAAVIQFDSIPGQVEANRERAALLIERAAAGGAQLLVLPELWPTGFVPEQAAALAEQAQGPSLSLLKRLAKQHQLWIIGGSIAERKQGKQYNTCFVVDSVGQLRGKYRKTHLFTYNSDEARWFSPGDEWTLCDYEQEGQSSTIGLSICYDLRFPELYRNLALRGARILAVPAAWVGSRISEYELFCRSRAAENRCYLLSADHSGSHNRKQSGNSLIVSPEGDILAKLGYGEGIAQAELDMDLLASPSWGNTLADRQPFIDEIDDNLL